MQNICNSIGWTGVLISETLKLLRGKYQWNVKRKKPRRDIQNIWIYTNLKHRYADIG